MIRRFGSKKKAYSTPAQEDTCRQVSNEHLNTKPGIMMRVARLATTYPKITILLILVMTIGFASRLRKIQVDDEILNIVPRDHPARLLQERIERDFGVRDLVILAVENEEGVFNPTSLALLKNLSDFLQAQPGIIAEDVAGLATTDNVVSREDELFMRPPLVDIPSDQEESQRIRDEVRDNPLFTGRLVSSGGTVAAVFAPIADGTTRQSIFYAVSQYLKTNDVSKNLAASGNRILVSGKVMIEGALGFSMRSDLHRLGPIVIILLLGLLTLYIRQPGIAFLPVLTGVIAVMWTMGLISALKVPVYLPMTLIPVMLLVICITDEVHLISEYRRRGIAGDRQTTLLESLKSILRPITWTSLTTAAGFLALSASPVLPLKHFGLFTAFGIGIAYGLTFTLTPAYLSLLRRPRRWRDIKVHRGEQKLANLGRNLSRHPVAMGLLLAAAGGIAIWGAAGTRVDENWVNRFKPGHILFDSDARLNNTLGGTTMLYGQITAKDGELKDPQVLGRIEKLQAGLEAFPQVGKATSVVDLLKRSNRILHADDPAEDRLPDGLNAVAQQLLLLESSGDPNDMDLWIDENAKQALLWIQLKDPYASTAKSLLPDMERLAEIHLGNKAEIIFGGPAHVNKAMADLVVASQLRSLAVSLGAVYLVLLLLFRSMAWSLLALVPLFMALMSVFAVLTSLGLYVDLPLAVLASITIGLGVDYAIYVLDRYRKARQKGSPLESAASLALAESGSVVLINSLVLAAGFSVLIFSHFAPLTVMGLLLAGVLLATAFVSLLLPVMVGGFKAPSVLQMKARAKRM